MSKFKVSHQSYCLLNITVLVWVALWIPRTPGPHVPTCMYGGVGGLGGVGESRAFMRHHSPADRPVTEKDGPGLEQGKGQSPAHCCEAGPAPTPPGLKPLMASLPWQL